MPPLRRAQHWSHLKAEVSRLCLYTFQATREDLYYFGQHQELSKQLISLTIEPWRHPVGRSSCNIQPIEGTTIRDSHSSFPIARCNNRSKDKHFRYIFLERKGSWRTYDEKKASNKLTTIPIIFKGVVNLPLDTRISLMMSKTMTANT